MLPCCLAPQLARGKQQVRQRQPSACGAHEGLVPDHHEQQKCYVIPSSSADWEGPKQVNYLYGAAQASMYASTALRVCRSGALSDFGHEAGSGADISLIDAYLQQLLPALAKSKAAAASKGVEVQRKCGSTERSVKTHK